MVQRLVKAWRMEMAGLIILNGGWINSLPVSPAAGDTGTTSITALGYILR
jgi:hypothetical protein